MPPSLPVLKGRDIVRVFESLGWQVARQSGSHIIMVKEGEIVTLSIPDHREGYATKPHSCRRLNDSRVCCSDVV